VAFWNRVGRHGRVDRALEENCGGRDVAYVADRGCFVDVDCEGRVEVVVVSAIHVDSIAWGKGLSDCSVGDCGVGYSFRVGVCVVGSCGCRSRG